MPKLSEIEFGESPWRPISESDGRKAAAIVANLIPRIDFVTDWRLQKAYYLAEVWSIEDRLRRLSGVDFASWTHGPWSLHVREAAESLEAQGLVMRVTQPAKRRPEAEFLKVVQASRIPHLNEEDKEFLASFVAPIRYLDGDTLTKIAKKTRPYIAAKPRQLIDLDGYLESLRSKHARLAESRKVASLVAEAKAESA